MSVLNWRHAAHQSGFAYLYAVNRFYWICLFCFGMFAGQLAGQVFNDPRKLGEALHQQPKLLVGLDTRHSFISQSDVKTIGLRTSLDFDKRARLGFEVYFLASRFYHNFVVPNDFGAADTIHAKLKFTYLTAYFEYVILATKHWECSVPIHVGIGDVGFAGLNEEPRAVLLTEGILLASYKIVPFFGLAGGIGYRHILAGGDLIRENFNSPTYSFGLKFWLGYLYQKYVKKTNP